MPRLIYISVNETNKKDGNGSYLKPSLIKKYEVFKWASTCKLFFMADIIFKDFSRKSLIFKYFSCLCKPHQNREYNTRVHTGKFE